MEPTRLSELTTEQWRDDAQFVAHELVARHKHVFYHVSREQFEQAVEELDGRIPSLATHEIVVELQALAALIGDGHTRLTTSDVQHRFPLQAYWFGQELRIVRALHPYVQALGARIAAVDDVDIGNVHAALQRIIPQGENEWYVREQSARQIVCAEVLAALGITRTREQAAFTFEPDDDSRFTVNVDAQEANAGGDWLHAARELPLYLQQPGLPFWFEYLGDADTMYVHFRSYHDLALHAQRLFEAVDTSLPKRLIIDMRHNGGGNYTLVRDHVISEIQNRPSLNSYGCLFVMIGRGTFSAAMTNATDFRRETDAMLIGEPTGARPNNFQENYWATLPHSRLRLSIACRRYRFSDADVDAVMPDQHIETSWSDYQVGRDPALEWILSFPSV